MWFEDFIQDMSYKNTVKHLNAHTLEIPLTNLTGYLLEKLNLTRQFAYYREATLYWFVVDSPKL